MNHSKKDPDFFTVNELAERWRVSTRHVRKMIGDGSLQPTRFGRAVRISLREVLGYEALGGR
jgi:excisionase family DNA binding protein